MAVAEAHGGSAVGVAVALSRDRGVLACFKMGAGTTHDIKGIVSLLLEIICLLLRYLILFLEHLILNLLPPHIVTVGCLIHRIPILGLQVPDSQDCILGQLLIFILEVRAQLLLVIARVEAVQNAHSQRGWAVRWKVITIVTALVVHMALRVTFMYPINYFYVCAFVGILAAILDPPHFLKLRELGLNFAIKDIGAARLELPLLLFASTPPRLTHIQLFFSFGDLTPHPLIPAARPLPLQPTQINRSDRRLNRLVVF